MRYQSLLQNGIFSGSWIPTRSCENGIRSFNFWLDQKISDFPKNPKNSENSKDYRRIPGIFSRFFTFGLSRGFFIPRFFSRWMGYPDKKQTLVRYYVKMNLLCSDRFAHFCRELGLISVDQPKNRSHCGCLTIKIRKNFGERLPARWPTVTLASFYA